ncbi:hypothetical protein AX15_004019 [Amanita polypyramis BW_CC]|nr:hypothetical protein AX15_004019 [Amanita polypyramis BW_CC]
MATFTGTLTAHRLGLVASTFNKCVPLRFTTRNQTCSIFNLPPDLLLDEIFPYLRVEDVMCLRRVNKAFFIVTHEPVIWKRFLLRMNMPLPPLRPSFRYTNEATDYEVEHLVTRAISLDDNWRRGRTRIRSNKIIATQHQVLDMVMVPGGKFLIASVRDEPGYRFYLVLYAMDHAKGHRALARTPTVSKAYFLQAKYGEWKGKRGIMIAYCRRRFQNFSRIGIDPSDYSHRTEIDPPIPFAYEIKCLHVELGTLEQMIDPRLEPASDEYSSLRLEHGPPFTEIEFIELDHVVTGLTLFEFNRAPYFGFVQSEGKIVLVDPATREIFVMTCADHPDHIGQEHRIRAFRVLPGQKDLLVVRTVSLSPTSDLMLVELYTAPIYPGSYEYTCIDSYTVSGKFVTSVQVTDYGIPTTTGDQPQLLPSSGPPPPISIYIRTSNPSGIVHHCLWPSFLDPPTTGPAPMQRIWFYDLSQATIQTSHVSSPYGIHVLPGAYRAMMYTVREDDRRDAPRVVNFRRYVNPGNMPWDYPRSVPDDSSGSVLRRPRYLIPSNVYASIDLTINAKTQLEATGLAAVAWDETIGRLCVAAGNDQKIRVMDFSNAVQPDARLAKWMKTHNYFRKINLNP